jgi:hypothetical protein
MLVLPVKRRLLICLICLFGFLNRAFAQTPTLAPHVDKRVELLSIVFRLAGNGEYNMNQLPAYSADIDRFFAPFKEHPAVQMARRLAQKDDGVGFDAVMAMAISLSPPPALRPLVRFTATTPDKRWGRSQCAEVSAPIARLLSRQQVRQLLCGPSADVHVGRRTLCKPSCRRRSRLVSALLWERARYGLSPRPRHEQWRRQLRAAAHPSKRA